MTDPHPTGPPALALGAGDLADLDAALAEADADRLVRVDERSVAAEVLRASTRLLERAGR